MVRRFVLGLLVALPVLARAGWTTVPAPGTPSDLQALDSGVVVFTSTGTGALGAAWLISADAGVGTIASLTGALVGATLTDTGCLYGITTGKAVMSSSGCPAAAALSCPTCPKATRFRTAPGGGTIAILDLNAAQGVAFTAASPLGPWAAQGAVTSLWSLPTPSTTVFPALATTRVSDLDFSVFNTGNVSPAVGVSVDAGAPAWADAGTNFRDLVALPFNNAPAVLGVTTAGGLTWLDDVRVGNAQPMVLSVPGGVTPAWIGFSLAGGSDAGAGFGMVTTSGGQVLSPIPDPARPGRAWRVRGGAPALSGRVSCANAAFCAAVGATGTLAVYFNEAAPQIQLPVEIVIAPGASVSAYADAGDADDDPLYLTWTPASPVMQAPADGGDGRWGTFSVPAGAAACADTLVPVNVTASDGLGSHTIMGATQVRIPRTLPVATASISPASTSTWAGAGPVSLSASVGSGCAPTGLRWSTSDGLDGGGSTFTWSPPATLCAVDGGVVTVELVALDPFGNSTPAQAQIGVAPWGAPLAPAFDAGATQLAGAVATWAPVSSVHACETSPGFPGTRLAWSSWDAGPGIAVVPVDGGLRIQSTDVCASGHVSAVAVRTVVGDPHALTSPPGSLEVDVLASGSGVGPGSTFSMGLAFDGGLTVVGQLSVDAGCTAPSLLGARVAVERPDGSVLTEQAFAVPGGWALPLVSECVAAPYRARAWLTVDGGVAGPQDSALISFEPWGPPAPPQLAATATQPAGEARFYPVASSPHACAGAAGFPGSRVAFLSMDAGPGLSLQVVDGGFQVASVDRCATGVAEVTVRDEVLPPATTPPSSAATAVIQVVPQGDVPGPGTPFFMHLATDGGGVLSGVFTLDAGCGVPVGLEAQVQAFSADASVVATGRFPVPGAWLLNVAPTCEPQQVQVVASLEDHGVAVGARDEALAPVAALDAVAPEPISADARVDCGAAAGAVLAWPSASLGCGFRPVTARVIEGLPVQVEVLPDGRLSVDAGVGRAELVGQSTRVEVVSAAGVSTTALVRWSVTPWVQAVAALPGGRAPEEESWSVPISLHAPACGAGELELVVRTSDVLVVGAHGDGPALTLQASPTEARIAGLPGEGDSTVWINARARMLGRPTLTPDVQIRGVSVMAAAPPAPGATGCGCGSSPGVALWTWVVLGAWAGARFRRRAP